MFILQVLSAGATLLKLDTRFSVSGGRTSRTGAELSIQRLGHHDAGEYVCQVQTDAGLQETKHVLSIQGQSPTGCPNRIPPRLKCSQIFFVTFCI